MKLLLLSVVLLSVMFKPATAAEVLATDGKSPYRIVVATYPIPSEWHAAEELQHYLEKMCGAKLPIVADSEPVTPHEILVGDNAHLRRLGLALDLNSLGTDGFTLRTEGGHIIIAGGQPRGTLYGVYSLLEDKLGVRWFTPEVEFVLLTNRLVLPALAETYRPALEYREVFWTEMLHDPDFAARHRLNGDHYHLTEKQGGRAEVYYPWVHSMDSLIPRELFHDHPEYFPLINGKRVDGYVQRCLSNPDVLKLAIKKVREWLKEHPDATIVSVSQNDTGNWCQCETCKALDNAEGSPSASLLRFVNAIAENIEPDYPKVRIDTLAYQYTRKPPKTIRPRKNVIIRLCSIECCFAHPLASCISPENRRFREDVAAWQPIAPTLYVWDYTPNFAHYQQPFPNFDALQPDVQFFVQHGVKGLFEEGNYSSGGNGELAPLRAYVLAELLWNPNLDVRKCISEFLNGYYGRAATQLQAYLQLLESEVQDPNVHAHIYDPPTAAYLNDNFIRQADALLDQAAASADNDTIRQRVEVAHLPVWYVKIATHRVTGGARSELLDQFLAVARKAGINQMSEGQSLDAWAKKMGK